MMTQLTDQSPTDNPPVAAGRVRFWLVSRVGRFRASKPPFQAAPGGAGCAVGLDPAVGEYGGQ
jgi:hypothetical protein